MIPVNDIIPGNIYSQDDASFLLGEGFTKAAAREAICEACRSGQLRSASWRRRYWFTGRAFLEWASRWFGTEIATDDDRADPTADRLAPVLRLGDNELTKQKPVAVRKGGR